MTFSQTAAPDSMTSSPVGRSVSWGGKTWSGGAAGDEGGDQSEARNPRRLVRGWTAWEDEAVAVCAQQLRAVAVCAQQWPPRAAYVLPSPRATHLWGDSERHLDQEGRRRVSKEGDALEPMLIERQDDLDL